MACEAFSLPFYYSLNAEKIRLPTKFAAGVFFLLDTGLKISYLS